MENFEKGKGAIKDILDSRDLMYENIAMGTPEFDWDKGFDIEDEISQAVGFQVKLKVKDQNGSGSCGGQAWSYYGEVLEALSTKTYEPRSAKFIYAQTHVMPAGSAGRTNCDLVINQGWCTEGLCSSYDQGKAPDEAFMQRVGDITKEMRDNAKKAKALVYANVATNIDLFAKAIRDNNGMVIGITGKNNGTWTGTYPKPPAVLDNNCWNHWVYAGKVKMIDGKKYIGFINSWGENVGDKGWQWVGEDYFKYYTGIGYAIWSGWTMVFKGEDPEFNHTFLETMRIGSRGEEVKALQKALEIEGMFKGVVDGIFGKITLGSVKTFQTRYSLVVDGIVGPKTRAKLNEIYSKK